MQGTILTTRDDRLLAAENAAVRRAYQRGELVRLLRGCYFPLADWARAHVWERYRIFLEAVSRRWPETVFALDSAAHLWNYPLLSPPTHAVVGVADRGRSGTGRAMPLLAPGVQPPPGMPTQGFGIRYRVVDVGEPDTVDGLAVTGRLPTVVDCAARWKFAAAVAVVDHARRPGRALLPIEAMADAVGHLRRADLRKAALRVLAFSSPASESPGESLSRANIHLCGFVPPVLQHVIADARGPFARADFYWPESKLVGEFDGRGKYQRAADRWGRGTGDVVMAEKDRENRIRRIGLGVVRWDWAEAKDREVLRGILAAAGVPRVTGTRLRERD